MHRERLIRPCTPGAQGYYGRQQLGLEWQLLSADPCVTEQPYLVAILLTPAGERPRKGGLKITPSWIGYRTYWESHSVVENC